jgi:hypothetical protein
LIGCQSSKHAIPPLKPRSSERNSKSVKSRHENEQLEIYFHREPCQVYTKTPGPIIRLYAPYPTVAESNAFCFLMNSNTECRKQSFVRTCPHYTASVTRLLFVAARLQDPLSASIYPAVFRHRSSFHSVSQDGCPRQYL